MTPYERRKTPFTQRMAEDMQVRNFSPRTIDSYTYHVDRYAKHFGKDPTQLGHEDVRNFQLWMVLEKKSSWSQFNQAVCGLRFFYSVTCKREWVVTHIPFGHVPKKLPNVLGYDEVANIISCITHTKHRTVVIILYAAGLRLSEALNLKLQDIDSNRMQLKVVQGKGRKDRYVPISPRLLNALRIYWKEFRPTIYLFPGLTHNVPLNGAVIQKVVTRSEPSKPFLVDNKELGRDFRDLFLKRLAKKIKQGIIIPEDAAQTEMIIKELSVVDWVVFIKGPPKKDCGGELVLKYLTRYMTGGPISSKRIIEEKNGRIFFWVRNKDKSGGQEKFSLPGATFVQQWCLHILPKEFTRSRFFGAWSNTKRKSYKASVAKLLEPRRFETAIVPTTEPTPPAKEEKPRRNCPCCEGELVVVSQVERPKWRVLFYGPAHPWWYEWTSLGKCPPC